MKILNTLLALTLVVSIVAPSFAMKNTPPTVKQAPTQKAAATKKHRHSRINALARRVSKKLTSLQNKAQNRAHRATKSIKRQAKIAGAKAAKILAKATNAAKRQAKISNRNAQISVKRKAQMSCVDGVCSLR